jgi:copper chaperone
MVEGFKLAPRSTERIPMNQSFDVQGMTCGHCVSAVTKALKAVDPQAEVKIDLAAGKVEVQSQRDRAALARAITEEGYQVAP